MRRYKGTLRSRTRSGKDNKGTEMVAIDFILIIVNVIISAVISICLWRIKRTIVRNEQNRNLQELCREDFMMNLMKMGVASLS